LEKNNQSRLNFITIVNKNTPFRGVFLFSVEKLTIELCTIFILSKLATSKLFYTQVMEDTCTQYRSQRQKAKEVLEQLEQQREAIYEKLKFNESSSVLHKDLRTINLDIKITLNEIEHIEYIIQECESNNNSILN